MKRPGSWMIGLFSSLSGILQPGASAFTGVSFTSEVSSAGLSTSMQFMRTVTVTICHWPLLRSSWRQQMLSSQQAFSFPHLQLWWQPRVSSTTPRLTSRSSRQASSCSLQPVYQMWSSSCSADMLSSAWHSTWQIPSQLTRSGS